MRLLLAAGRMSPLVVAVGVLLALGVQGAAAAPITVTSNADSGAGSLRAAIASASSGDTVEFAPVLDGQTITLASGELTIGKNLTITGPGATHLTISGNGASRVLYVSSGTVDISGLTITDGNGTHPSDGSTNQGDDIDVEGASTSVTLDGLAITGANGSLFGGGVGFSDATVHITNSTIAANTVTGFAIGGGIWQDGGTMTLTNDTITGNTGTSLGGGIAEATAPSSAESASLTNVTLASNQATSQGGNIFATHGTIFKNTIIAGGMAASKGNCAYNTGEAPVSEGHNLEDTNTCNLTGSGDQVNTNPNLGPLAYNGGQTQTLAPQLGSPAIAAVPIADCPSTDQVGDVRPAAAAACDVGAFQTSYTRPTTPPTVTGISPSSGPTAGGTMVTLTGTGFLAGASVSFGSNAASNVVAASSTSITATVPAGSGTVDVVVTDTSGTSAVSPADRYTYNAPASGSTGVTGSTGSSGSTSSGPSGTKPLAQTPLALATQLGLPSTTLCLSMRKLTIHVTNHIAQKAGAVNVKSAEVLLAGHVVARLKGSHLVAHVSLVGQTKGSFKITIKVITITGKTLTASSTYHTCRRGKHKRK